MADEPAYLQQPGESGPAYAGFLTYRDQSPDQPGGRTVAAAWRQHTGHTSLPASYFRGWSKKWRWQERATAWDATLLEREAAETAKARARRKERRRDQAAAFREGLAAPAGELLRRMETRELDLKRLGQGELLQLAILCGRVFPRLALLERLEEGEATELVGTSAWTGPVPDVRPDAEHQADVFAALAEAGWEPRPVAEAEVLQLPVPRDLAG